MNTLLSRAIFTGLTAAAATAQGVNWTATLDEALRRAKAENKVIMVAMNIDGERGADAMTRQHYRDPMIVQLSQRTINLFCSNDVHGKANACPRCGSGDCSGHRNNDFNVRRRFFGIEDQTKVTAPQHLFVSPNGKVIGSAARWITVGELEWMWVHAIREVESKFEWAETGRFRAPARYKKADVDKTESRLKPPPTSHEVADALKDAKKAETAGGRGGRGGRGGGRGGFGGQADDRFLDIILRSDQAKALKYGEDHLKSSRDRSRLLRKVGQLSPEPWFKVVAAWLTSDVDLVRRAATQTLEQLREGKAMGALRKQYRVEKSEELRGRLLRAMATVAPTDRSTITTVKKVLDADKSEVVRAHATVAAGTLEDRAAVTECLKRALQDDTMLIRSVAAYVIAVRQDKALTDALRLSLAAETDAEAKEWMTKAQAAVRDADPKAFENFLAETLDKPEPRGRGRGPADGGGGTDGGGTDGGGGTGRGGGGNGRGGGGNGRGGGGSGRGGGGRRGN